MLVVLTETCCDKINIHISGFTVVGDRGNLAEGGSLLEHGYVYPFGAGIILLILAHPVYKV